jgi:diaminohydroxyphosphoribosylaminopyrimidine deaminase / 5-amino-6-(5-phosphoribosylamino)uracil reductase
MTSDVPHSAETLFEADARFMALALTLGRRGLGNTWPNPAVGAVVVNDGIVVGRGWTQPGGRPHAEIEALRRAGAAARGATLYATLEPCSHHGRSPPCADAIVAAGVVRVLSAMEDPNPEVAGMGHARLRAAGVAVEVGLGAEEARRGHGGHIRRMRERRPHVTLKLAVSADEKVALAGRKPIAITGEAANERVHRLRAQHDAILIGIGTALADDPLLTCRLPGMAVRSPVRVVLDSALRLAPTSRLAATSAQTLVWIFADQALPGQERPLADLGVEVLRVPGAGGRLDLTSVLRGLAERGITRLMVEGGPTVAAAFVAADLVDEIALFRSSKTIGTDGVDALEGSALATLTRSPRFKSRGAARIGDDSMESFERA